VRESLIELQRSDPELSRIVQLRLTFTVRPKNEEIEGESELTKKLCNNWDTLEVHDDLMYRKFVSKRSGKPNVLELLVPSCQVAEILRQSHAWTVNGHFGNKRTPDQVQRRFYWSTWKSDTVSNVPSSKVTSSGIVETSYVRSSIGEMVHCSSWSTSEVG